MNSGSSGYDGIPGEWLAVIRRREWIEELCRSVDYVV